MTIFGWDASDFDSDRGQMDMAAAARDGIAFLTHKATEGTRTKHTRYGAVLNRARAAGITVLGAYAVPRTPGNGGHGSVTAQVDYLLAYADQQTPWWRTWRHWMWQVDLEHWSYDKVPPAVGVEMARQLRARTGRFVALYAPQWAYGDSIGGDVPLWASNYGSNPVGSYRGLYPGDGSSRWAAYSGRTPIILQYGSQTRIGSQNTCDANAFRGSLAQLQALVAGTAANTEEDEMAFLDDKNARALAYREHCFANMVESVTTQIVDPATGKPELIEHKGVAAIKALQAGQATSEARDRADEVRDQAVLAAIQGLAVGGPDAAPQIVSAVNAVRDEARQQFGELLGRIAELERDLAAARAAAEANLSPAERAALSAS